MAKILKLKISLAGIEPTIWRQFAVKDSISFNYLHKIIQKVMGWENYHLFEFKIDDETITSPEEGHNLAEASFKTMFKSPEFIKMLEEKDKSGQLEGALDISQVNKILENANKSKPKERFNLKTKICQLLNTEGQKFTYVYDFGDDWEHILIVEKIGEEDKTKKYPLCLAGERACPPEDCGNIDGYYELMEIRKDKNHPEYKERIVEWLGEEYDPDFFSAERADFALREKENASRWFVFIPIGNLLKEDTQGIREIKTIFNHEDEYKDYLLAVEYTIAELFLEDRTLKDKEVEQAIRNIKKNYHEKLDFFQTRLEKEIVMEISIALQEKGITHHELKLILDYVLWSIDNRNWMSNNQAFVKWLPFFFDLYDEKEKTEYEHYVIKLGRRLGLPQSQINGILMKDDEAFSEETEESSFDSQFFSLDEDKKFDFVVAHALKNPFILEKYSLELDEKQDYHTVERLYLKMMELSNNFALFEWMLGINYIHLGDKEKAKKHLESAMKRFQELPHKIDDKDTKEILDMMKKTLEKIQNDG